jgi:hypothetical protein
MLLEALATLRTTRGEDNDLTKLASTRLAKLHEAWGKPGRNGR